MKRTSYLFIAIFAIFVIGLVVSCRAKADTLTLSITSAQFNDGTMYVGPYLSQITGGEDSHAFSFPIYTFCIDYTSHVGFGQTFNITAYNLADYTGPLATEYWEAGWLALQMGLTTDVTIISQIQRAMWIITTPGTTDPYLNAGVPVHLWVQQAIDNYQTVSADHFEIYVRDGLPGQTQLALLNVPEPSTYAMAGIGLLALLGFNLKRRLS